MIKKKHSSFLSLPIVAICLLMTVPKNLYSFGDCFKKEHFPIKAILSCIVVVQIWEWLAARGGSSSIKARNEKATIAHKTVQQLLPKLKASTINSEEAVQLLNALWSIFDAEWIGFYKKPKERIGVTFKTNDGRAIVIDAQEKTSGSYGLGKVYQKIEGLCRIDVLLKSLAGIIGTAYILDAYSKDKNLSWFFNMDKTKAYSISK